MDIHIVQQGETIFTIADKYKVPANRLILENDINPDKLVIGQAIVILYPAETYIVKQGDSLESIANSNNIPVMQLFRNNNYLFDRKDIYPDEELVLSYNNNKGNIYTNGYVNQFIDLNTLKRTLPYLSYISIFGYSPTLNGDIIEIDDSEIIKMTKAYGVAPLMLLSAYSLQGVSNLQAIYDVLLNEDLSNKLIDETISLLKTKGYYGLNITYLYLNMNNAYIYEQFTKRLTKRFKNEGFKLFISVALNSAKENILEIIDKSILNDIDGIFFIDLTFGKNYDPPSPITSIKKYDEMLKNIDDLIPNEKIDIGCPLIGYDWKLPYVDGKTVAYLLKLNTAVELAQTTNSTIYFDDLSQTPYFNYIQEEVFIQNQHIVWFIDVRTINELLNLIVKYNLHGTGIWNIMYFFSQIWLVVNSQYKIIKLFPEP